MAKFYSIQTTLPYYPVSGPGMGGRSEKLERGFIDFSAGGATAIGDTIDFFDLPRNFRVMGGYLKSTGAAASATLAIGDAGNAARYFAATAITTAGTSTTLAETGRDFLVTAKTRVFGTLAGAGAGATGTITLVLFGIIEEPA